MELKPTFVGEEAPTGLVRTLADMDRVFRASVDEGLKMGMTVEDSTEYAIADMTYQLQLSVKTVTGDTDEFRLMERVNLLMIDVYALAKKVRGEYYAVQETREE